MNLCYDYTRSPDIIILSRSLPSYIHEWFSTVFNRACQPLMVCLPNCDEDPAVQQIVSFHGALLQGSRAAAAVSRTSTKRTLALFWWITGAIIHRQEISWRTRDSMLWMPESSVIVTTHTTYNHQNACISFNTITGFQLSINRVWSSFDWKVCKTATTVGVLPLWIGLALPQQCMTKSSVDPLLI